jgi:uncharacterized membrane protein YqhA
MSPCDRELLMGKFLAACRFLLVVPVLGSVALAIAAVLMGAARVVGAIGGLLAKGEFDAKAAKDTSVFVIEVIDLFLIGTVAYITAVGLYKLFISRTDVVILRRVRIETVKDLEDKIIGVLVAALGIAFLGHAVTDEPAELLNYGGGIAVVIAALGFFIKQPSKPKPSTESPDHE